VEAAVSNPLASLACLACLTCVSVELGCAPRTPAPHLTSAESSTRFEDEAAGALRAGAAERALGLANRAVLASPASPWAHYDRAVALQALARADEALEDFRVAERLFGYGNAKGRSLALYGRARTLTDAGRCSEAHVAYEQYADVVRALAPRAAALALAYEKDCREATSSLADRASSEAASALIGGDYLGALERAAEAPAAQTSPWLAYNRAVALGELGRTDEAVATFEQAERRFGDDEVNRHGRAIAIYGRARALAKAGRCAEARGACEQYARLTGEDRARCRSC
jgi:hypothetical protein